jgi:preprotein translocase subunit SecG
MSLFIGFLTLVLVLDCLLLMLLVLIQLPKKEAGMGQAFGGGATDALFGPGSGNALTKLTKYAAGTFLVLCLLVSVLNARRSTASKSRIERELQNKAATTPAPAPLPVAPVPTLNTSNVLSTPLTAPASTNATPPAATTPAPKAATNAAPKAATNAAPKAGK